ncbi:oxidoreductase [Granulosicoccaceae sp. 1_MG-2023]|nr:oxidoreductase [Granulosicoccaceae sp. 1_MG-2023]
MQQINVALFGYGYVGKTFHAPLINSVDGLKLSTVVSGDKDKVLADLPGVSVERDHAAAVARDDVDLVVIATPNDSHFPLARLALQADKHVVIDKPFTTTVAEAEELIALAESRSLLLSAFHNRRWDADFLTLKELIHSGRLGEVVYFESHFDRYRPQVVERWRETAEHGGLWYDLGPHLVDQALQLFGMPDAVSADLARQREGAKQIDYFHVLLRYARLRVVLHGSTLVPGGSARFLVHGTKASFRKAGLDTQEAALKRGEQPGCENWGVDDAPGELILPQDTGPQAQAVPGRAGDYRQYYAGVRDALRGEGPDPVPASQAADVMRIIELAIAAAAEGRERCLSCV